MKRYISHIISLALSVIALIAACAFPIRAQELPSIRPLDPNGVPQRTYHRVDTIYAMPGEKKSIKTMDGSDDANTWTYFRWYNYNKGYDKHTDWLERITYTKGRYTEYTNGFALWTSSSTGGGDDERCYIHYTAPSGEKFKSDKDGIVDIVACDVSILSTTEPIEPRLSGRYLFYIKDARKQYEAILRYKEVWGENNALTNEIIAAHSKYFKEYEEIHAPLGKLGVTLRMQEDVQNYVLLPENSLNRSDFQKYCADRVRWTVYQMINGKPEKIKFKHKVVAETRTVDKSGTDGANIIKANFNNTADASESYYVAPNTLYFFDDSETQGDTQVQKELYVTAEVSRGDGGEWYPITLIHLFLEPYSSFTTQSELKEVKDLIDNYVQKGEIQKATERELYYYARTPEYIRDNFEVLDSITFDIEGDFGRPTQATNYAPGGISPKDPAYLESVSSYLFSYPKQRTDNHTSPRYSYALYKSLNGSGVSQSGQGYTDWWMSRYNVQLYDRRHEQNPDEYGYFLYVDAAEKPGTLATLRLNNDLCPDTRILVTAWVANMQYDINPNKSCLPADIGLTFFGVRNGERTQINKYYSGSARRVPENGSGQNAEWQQIYFYFNFQEGDLEYDSYLLELNNNTSHSNGADYAIDDIKVYRSKVNFGAEQLTPHCDDEDIRMVVYGEYDNLMFTAARNEVEDINQDTPDGEVFDIYFRFYNQDGSIIRFDYNNEGEGSNTTFGKMKINTCYDEMTEFDQNNPGNEHEVAYRKTDKAGKRYVVFTTVIPNAMTDESRPLDPGKTYYVQLQPCPGEDAGGHNHDDENPPAFEWDGTGGKEQFELFRRTNKCKLISPFTIRKSTTIRLDGVMDVEDAGRLCPGRTVNLDGVVQVYDYVNGKWYPDINILFDWYIKSGDEETDNKIISLLEEFRRENQGELGEEELKNLLKNDEYNLLYEAAFSEEVKYHSLYFEREKIEYTVSDKDESGSIGLFLFPLKPENWTEVIPEIRDEDIRWCLNPTEATIEIGGPKLVLGFPEVNYPEDYKARVRIGKGQVTTLTSKNVVKNELYIPINKVLPSIGVDRLVVGKKDEPDATSYAVLVDANSETKIAKVFTFQADRGNGEDYLVLDFTENEQPFSPKEGHQYLVRIFFRDAPSDDQEIICEGAVEFYFRIVPEYLTWTGTGSGIANWNNDKAWMRSDRTEDLYFTKQDPETDWGNAFAPMKFTYVTVKADNSPYLYTAEPDQEKGGVLNLTLNKPEKIGDATKNIEYDLMVKEADAGKDYGFDCEKYYTNTVKEIYFKPEATLMNQQLLTYEKAHVDFEMANGKKYWLASPLQGVVAGDMYAPKFNGDLHARQETPAFEDIPFTDSENDRFNPAFFQRSWDRAVNMYLPGENNRKEYQVVESNWSIEYNDVTVPYSIGKGFYASVEMDGAKGEYEALVRLPKKADNDYVYQTKPTTKATQTRITREEDNGKLAEGETIQVSLTEGNDASSPTGLPDGDEKHFLVGNPYMTHLDMDKFFAQNSFLTQKYWIVEDGIEKAEIKQNGEWSGGQTDRTVAPMTAFFVEKKGQGGSDKITFNTSMMKYSADVPRSGTRAVTAGNPHFTITAERNGKKSRCVITQNDLADNRYDAGEDAVVLLDKQEERFPTVYSIAGNQAAIYNSVEDWKNIPIGIYSDSKEEVTLTFEGMEQLAEPIYLYDALTKESIRLDALNPRVTVPGSTHGRYFLNGTDQQTAENAIAVYSPTPGQLVVAAPAPETLKQIWIYTVAGQLVQAANGLDTSVQTFNLPKGIYMVEATSEQAITKTKVYIR